MKNLITNKEIYPSHRKVKNHLILSAMKKTDTLPRPDGNDLEICYHCKKPIAPGTADCINGHPVCPKCSMQIHSVT